MPKIPATDFRPSSGLLTHVAWPEGIRVDPWVESGTEVSPFYDPMLAKLIATGATRDEALQKLQAALDATEIGGLETNLDYLRQLSRLEFLRAATCSRARCKLLRITRKPLTF